MDKKFHEITVIQTDGEFLLLLVDGQTYRILWQDCSPRLAQASGDERRHIRISPSGYGLHWPLIDEDLAIDPLLHEAEQMEFEATPA